MSALLNKSFGDLKRRKARTFFTILTIALAVSALGMFAVMPLIDEAMEQEVEDSNLHNLQLSVNDLNLTEENLNDLENLENVKSVESKSIFFTRMYVGERRNDAIIIGVKDFSDQNVNIVKKDSGTFPGTNEVLSSSSNSRYDLYNGDIGDTVKIYNHQGQVAELKISGTGHTFEYSSYPAWGLAIFYADLETVHSLANTTGINIIDFDLGNTDEKEVDKTVLNVETYLKENTTFVALTDLPWIVEDGDYPGKQEGNDFANFFYVLTLLTVFCSLFLISNTMHTMITEQRREIGQLKAVGATKLQVFRSYFTTSFIMGLIGAVIGAVLGVFIAYSLSSFIGSNFYGITLRFSIHMPTILISILIGIGITILATLPALYKALRVTAREGMQDSGLINGFGHSIMDRALMKMGLLPRCTQMGLRNITRKKGRSISTILQVALAVGMFLAVIAFGQSLNVMVSEEWDNHTYDILTLAQTEGGKPLTEEMQFVLEDIDGVSVAEPIVGTGVMLDDRELTAVGYNYNTIGYNIDKTIFKGRWFTKQEQENNATVTVFSKTIADLEKIKVGNTVDIIMATGTYQFKVIGLSSGIMNNGMCAFMPITTIQDKMLMNDNVSGFIIKTDNDSHDLIDRTATTIEDEMLSRGYVTENMIQYIAEEQNHRANQQIINLMAAVGALIILITMIGLMSTMTMNIIERTKEIGMLRCVGSSSWSIRSVFGTEGLVLALIGWVVGIPIGYTVGSFLNYMIYDMMHLEMTFVFPLQFVFFALVITTIATLIVIQPPLWRATHFKPGDSLRYE